MVGTEASRLFLCITGKQGGKLLIWEILQCLLVPLLMSSEKLRGQLTSWDMQQVLLVEDMGGLYRQVGISVMAFWLMEVGLNPGSYGSGFFWQKNIGHYEIYSSWKSTKIPKNILYTKTFKLFFFFGNQIRFHAFPFSNTVNALLNISKEILKECTKSFPECFEILGKSP